MSNDVFALLRRVTREVCTLGPRLVRLTQAAEGLGEEDAPGLDTGTLAKYLGEEGERFQEIAGEFKLLSQTGLPGLEMRIATAHAVALRHGPIDAAAEAEHAEVLVYAATIFHPALMSLLHNIVEAPKPLPSAITVHASGEAFGYDWPLVRIRGGLFGEINYYISIAPYAPDELTIGRDPLWPGHMPDITVPLDDPAIVGRTLWLTDWSQNCLEVDLACWGTTEEKARLWAELEGYRDEA